MAKKRIYEVAKELDIENKIVVKKAQDLGFDVKSHMSSLDDKQVSNDKKTQKAVIDLASAVLDAV